MNFLNTQSKTFVRTLDAWVIGFNASAFTRFDFYGTDLSEINSVDVCVLKFSSRKLNDMDSDFSHSECKRINTGSHTAFPIKAIKYRLN